MAHPTATAKHGSIIPGCNGVLVYPELFRRPTVQQLFDQLQVTAADAVSARALMP
jgi:hypothetical protein